LPEIPGAAPLEVNARPASRFISGAVGLREDNYFDRCPEFGKQLINSKNHKFVHIPDFKNKDNCILALAMACNRQHSLVMGKTFGLTVRSLTQITQLLGLDQCQSSLAAIFDNKSNIDNVKRMAGVLSDHSSLTKMVARKDTPDEVLTAIAEVVADSKSLKYLEFIDVDTFTTENIAELAVALPKSKTLQYLSFQQTHLDEADAKVLSEALAKSSSLASLDLSETDADDDSVKEWVTVLSGTPQLVQLKLDNNPIGRIGISHLSKAVRGEARTLISQGKKSSLRSLSLSGVRADGAAQLELIKALDESETLEKVVISGRCNQIQEDIEEFKSKGKQFICRG